MNIHFPYSLATVIVRYAIVATMCLLSSCSTLWPQSVVQVAEGEMPPLQYYAWVTSASRTDIDSELARLVDNSASTDPLVHAVQLGLLLSMSVQASADNEQHALALFNDVKNQPVTADTRSDYVSFAEIFHQLLLQRIELRQATSFTVDNLAEIDSLKLNIQLLQEKITALTVIEEQQVEREQMQK